MQSFITGIMTVAVVFGVFLLCRHVVCWYFKLNDVVELLKAIRDK